MTEVMQRGRHMGWSAAEDKLLWETADEAQQQGLPLKAVFEKIAGLTGRRPNSIRNYYYAQARQKDGGAQRKARFVPFQEDEVEKLLETVLRDRAQGISVHACLNRISGGDRTLLLRYQNKYRAVIKTRPDLVEKTVEKLRAEGIDCDKPVVRARDTLSDACGHMVESARHTGDAELVRACEILAKRLQGEVSSSPENPGADKVRYDLCRMALQDAKRACADVCECARPLVACVKEQIALSSGGDAADAFLASLTEKIGPLEEAMTRAGAEASV